MHLIQIIIQKRLLEQIIHHSYTLLFVIFPLEKSIIDKDLFRTRSRFLSLNQLSAFLEGSRFTSLQKTLNPNGKSEIVSSEP